jgi:exonuclease III
MDEERAKQVEDLSNSRLHVIASGDPENPTRRGGVAIIINKTFLDASNAKIRVIVPGRALLVQTNHHKGEKLSILSIYAPTAHTDNEEFWTYLRDFFRRNATVRRPDVVLGDFNMVEDEIDRLPVPK